jgi:hypothetical protein
MPVIRGGRVIDRRSREIVLGDCYMIASRNRDLTTSAQVTENNGANGRA